MTIEQKMHSILRNPIYDKHDRIIIREAFDTAKNAHRSQKRISGHSYIVHPVAVASFLAKLNLDASTIAAALLHDTIEDTHMTKEKLERKFGKEIAFLVDSVTRLGIIRYSRTRSLKQKNKFTNVDPHINSLKKMFFAMAKDVRVILIKLADRYHNIQTIRYMGHETRQRIAHETIEIYAHIAERLGMGYLKGRLEDLAFPYAYPTEYKSMLKMVHDPYETRKRYIKQTRPVIMHLLKDSGVNIIDTHSRVKHYWSLFQKLCRNDMDVEKIFDLVALRIIVPDIKSCYETLGIVHKHYHPLPGKIKDYIALPKPNGYRSIHTTVFCEKGRIAEFQIRTASMHEYAENGIAAHWAYAESGKQKHVIIDPDEIRWIKQLRNFMQDIKTNTGLQSLKIDFFKNRIFVFTPNGDIRDLPEGATSIDFAYSIHTDLGNSIAGAKIDGKIAPLASELRNGNVVEIIKNKKTRPSLDWLRMTKTALAKKLIRAWFKKNNPVIAASSGKLLLNNELKKFDTSLEKLGRKKIKTLLARYSSKTQDDLSIRISMGDVDVSDITKQLFRDKTIHAQKQQNVQKPPPKISNVHEVLIQGQKGVLYKLGKCCNPAYGGEIHGYITRSQGITVHLSSCINIKNANKKRLLSVMWK